MLFDILFKLNLILKKQIQKKFLLRIKTDKKILINKNK